MSVPYPVVAFASSSKSILLASGSGVHIYNPSTSAFLSETSENNSSTSSVPLVRLVAISQDGNHAASLSDDKSLMTYDLSHTGITIRNTRTVIKKGSYLSFSPDRHNNIILSDKTGDMFSYPLDPKPLVGERPKQLILNSDPSLNPDATLILGHVSILTCHCISRDGKKILSADRDEHIRISRYPDSYVVDRYLFGAEGFVSALHISELRPEVLISGGGEGVLRIWDWTTGRGLGMVDISEEVLPHRRVRCSYRRARPGRKGQGKKTGKGEGKSQAEDPRNGAGEMDLRVCDGSDPAFYEAPEGWKLPAGDGICIKKIDSIRIGDQTVIVFFSEGAAAVHSFVLPSDPTSLTPKIHTLPTSKPVLDFTFIPDSKNRILLSVDSAWGILKENTKPTEKGSTKHNGNGSKPLRKLQEGESEEMSQILLAVDIGPNGELSLNTSDPLPQTLINHLTPTPTSPSPSHQTRMEDLAALDLYPNLSIYPRWPGMEEDDDLAGPTDLADTNDSGDTSPAPTRTDGKTWTMDELDKMNVKQLGRLKAQGVDIGDLIRKKEKEMKERGPTRKKIRLERGDEAGGEDEEMNGNA